MKTYSRRQLLAFLQKLPRERFWEINFREGVSFNAEERRSIQTLSALKKYCDENGHVSLKGSFWQYVEQQFSFRLAAAQTGLFVYLCGNDFGYQSRTTHGMWVRMTTRARQLGLEDCPLDTPIFTQMQTDSNFAAGYHNTLKFPSCIGKYKEQWATLCLNAPLDARKLVWSPMDSKVLPSMGWAFKVPGGLLQREDMEFVHANLPERALAI